VTAQETIQHAALLQPKVLHLLLPLLVAFFSSVIEAKQFHTVGHDAETATASINSGLLVHVLVSSSSPPGTATGMTPQLMPLPVGAAQADNMATANAVFPLGKRGTHKQ